MLRSRWDEQIVLQQRDTAASVEVRSSCSTGEVSLALAAVNVNGEDFVLGPRPSRSSFFQTLIETLNRILLLPKNVLLPFDTMLR